jgi:hypothetical protein
VQKRAKPENTPIFSQLGKNNFPVREKFFSNWEKKYT